MNTDLKRTNKGKKNTRRNEIRFTERLIKISRVSKVTKGGKKLSFRAIVVIGDEIVVLRSLPQLRTIRVHSHLKQRL